MTIDSNNNINKYGPPGLLSNTTLAQFSLNNLQYYIYKAKRFVREWARLRYGVFEEHGYTTEDTPFPMFYRQSQNPIAPVRSEGPLVPNICADKPTLFTVDNGCKVDPVTGLYSTDCTYTLKSEFKPDSSMLSDYKMLQSVHIYLTS